MASSDRSTYRALIERILAHGKELPFLGVVRILADAHPQSPAVGGDGPPRQEAVRFRPSTSLGFSSSDLRSVRRVADDGSGFRGFEVVTNFLSLAGSDSPLPNSYVERFVEDEEEESVVYGLLSIIHHRLVSLLLRGTYKYRPGFTYRWDGSDRFSRRLLRLAEVRSRAADDLPKGDLLRFIGLIARRARSADQLERALGAFLDHEVRVEPCVPRRIGIPQDQRLRLGRSHCTLGVDSTLGDTVLDRSCTIGIHIEHLKFKEFNEYLPGGRRERELRACLSLLLGDAFDCVLSLDLDEPPPPLVLNGRPGAERRYLGRSTWLGHGGRQSTGQVSFLLPRSE